MNKNTIIVLDSEEKAVELCTEEYFKGNNKTKINGRKFDIFNFGNSYNVCNSNRMWILN